MKGIESFSRSDPGHDDDEDDDNIFSYKATTCTDPDEFVSVDEHIEQDIVVASDADAAEEASSCVHDDLFVLYRQQRAPGKGVPVDKRIHSFRPVFRSQD